MIDMKKTIIFMILASVVFTSFVLGDDTTPPILNATTPANNTYIIGGANQLFRVYVYDDTLNTSNVSLYWRSCNPYPSACGGWNSPVALTCELISGSTIGYNCNNTVNLDGRVNGEIVAYYFEATDNSQLYNSNGTASDPLQVTIARNSSWSAITTKFSTPATYWYNETHGFQVTWTGVGLANSTFQLGRPDGRLVNYTNNSAIAVSNVSGVFKINFTQDQLGPVGPYNYTWFGIDRDGSENKSNTTFYNVAQNTYSKLRSTFYRWNDTDSLATSANQNVSAIFPQMFSLVFAWDTYNTETYNMILYRNGIEIAYIFAGDGLEVNSTTITGASCADFGYECVWNQTKLLPGTYNITAFKEATENYTAFSLYRTVEINCSYSAWVNTSCSGTPGFRIQTRTAEGCVDGWQLIQEEGCVPPTFRDSLQNNGLASLLQSITVPIILLLMVTAYVGFNKFSRK